MKDTVAGNDCAWSYAKIRLLVDGEFLSDETMFVSRSAFDMRRRAMDGYAAPDSTLDAVQLIGTIRKIRDREVRDAMLLRVVLGWDEYEIQLHLGSRRAGHHLLDRGSELVRRIERTEHNMVKAKRASDAPVCWKCMKVQVRDTGSECDDCATGVNDKPLPGRPQGSGTPVSEWSLERLIETQDAPDEYHMPGHTAYKERVVSTQDVNVPRNREWQDMPSGGRMRRNLPTSDNQ